VTRAAIATVVALAGSLGCAALGDPRASAETFVALVLCWGAAIALLSPGERGAGPFVIGAVALAVRLPLLTLPSTLSDDLYRYLWEGKVLAAGLSPYALAPESMELAPLRDATWPLVNHKAVPSCYPPGALLLFFGVHRLGEIGLRAIFTFCDAFTAVVLAKQTARGGWTWALLPLPAIEAAVSGHLEAPGALMVALALGGRQGFAFAATLVKLLPVALLLRPLRRWPLWIGLGAVVVAPFADANSLHGLQTYAAHWSFDGSLWPILAAWVGDDAARKASLAGFAAVTAWIAWRSRDPGRVMLWSAGAWVCLSPTVHPWYVLWPLVAALWNGSTAWTVLAVTVPVAYRVLGTIDPATGAWQEEMATRWVIYVPFYVALSVEAWQRLTRAGPAPVH
jgi:hypothetical protein